MVGRLVLRAVSLALLLVACLGGTAVAAGPTVVGSISNDTSLSGVTAVAVSGHYAYSVAAWSGSLSVIDISDASAPRIVGSTPSTSSLIAASNVTVSGHYAFVTSENRNASTSSNDDGSGNSLTIVDITNPAAPSVVGTVSDPSSPRNVLFGAYAVAVSGHYAFVASQGTISGQPMSPSTSEGSFAVIDITNPAGPTVVKNIDNADPSLTGVLANALFHATSVAISGHFAYVTAFLGSRLTVIDISNPADPVVVSSLHDATNLSFPEDLVINGSYAYVVNEVASSPQVAVVSLANPTSPAVVGVLTNPSLSGAYRVKMRGSSLYVAGSNAASVAAVDVSNPTAPRLVAAATDTSKLAHVTGLDLDSTGRYVIAASPRGPSDPRVNYPPYPLQGGPAVTGTVSVVDFGTAPRNTGLPKISGTAQQGKVLSADAGTWSGLPAPTYRYQWQRCTASGRGCKDIRNQTGDTYKATASDVGARLGVVVTATNSVASVAASSALTRIVKWSSGSFAKARLTKSKTATPRLSLDVPSPGTGIKLTSLTISLPRGISFVKAFHARAVSLRGLSRRLYHLKVTRRHGVITIKLRRPAGKIELTLARGVLRTSRAFKKLVRSRKAKFVPLKLTLDYRGKPTRRGPVQCRLA